MLFSLWTIGTRGCHAFVPTMHQHQERMISRYRNPAIATSRREVLQFLTMTVSTRQITTETQLSAVKNRGLEQRREGATPTREYQRVWLRNAPE